MSAFQPEPQHFIRWLSSRGEGHTKDCFVPRAVFGDYVRDLLNDELKRSRGEGRRLSLVRADVDDMAVTSRGVTLRAADGRTIEASVAVLAVGNFPPEAPPIEDASFYDGDRYRADPWAPDALAGLDPASPVLLIGTGLTMVDTVMSLLDGGHRGRIHALSRRGLLPHRHASAGTSAPSPLLGAPLPTSISGLTRTLRRAIAGEGGQWRSIIDGLRPWTQEVWQAMTIEERARFARHLRPWWEIHRHRLPPAVAARLDAAIAAGRVSTAAGQLRSLRVLGGQVEAAYRPRGLSDERRIRIQRVINCSGPGCDYDRIVHPLVRRLLDRGDVQPDALRLGLDVSASCALKNRSGEIWPRLFAVGPVTKPLFWEITSVPDIRQQCEALATQIARKLQVEPTPPALPATASSPARALA
jgi:uncharacterized NAD(P)/FAD-binding protein YdhS